MANAKTLVTKSKRRRGKDDSDSSMNESEPSPKRAKILKMPKKKTVRKTTKK